MGDMRRPLPHEFPRSVVVVRAFHPDLMSKRTASIIRAIRRSDFVRQNLDVLLISCLCETSSKFKFDDKVDPTLYHFYLRLICCNFH